MQVRWTIEMEEYKEVMKIANAGRQQKLKQEMLKVAKESVFYLNTLVHHASKQYVYIHVQILYTMFTCLITHIRWTEASPEDKQTAPNMQTEAD